MTIKEANRLSIMKQVDKKILSLRKASEELGLSVRHTKRIRRRYLDEGEEGLISKHKGKISPNRIPDEIKEKVLKFLQKEEYAGFAPTFANEKLKERSEHDFSNETLRKWMSQAGLWKCRRRKEKKLYQRRMRRPQFGELLQGDGSRHAWFENRGEVCTIIVLIDDATSKITSARFVPVESTEAYQQTLEDHLVKYGRPRALYVDKHAIFRTSRGGEVAKDTHFGRVLKDLDIELICAHSPQAKGRVERANATLQDRLIKEMRLEKINNIEEANQFLPKFLECYNAKFGKKSLDPLDAHRPMRKQDNLERIFARRATRKVSKDLSFQYEGELYQIQANTPNRFRSTYVNIFDRPGKPIIIESQGREYSYSLWKKSFVEKPLVLDSKELESYWSVSNRKKPSINHPWR